ncbi:MAG: sigma 54-interacting transcriptional regulator [Desulfobacteraceae bacterium]|nr:sigma 54-interacting transcriptional regulator [Desulfobacteraceae bacterium]
MGDLADYWESIMDVLNDGVYITDHEGKTIMVNRMYEQLTGLSRADLQDKLVTDLVDEGKFDVVLNPAIVTSGRPKTIVQRTKVGKTVLLHGFPVFDPEGKVALVVTFVRDITSLSRVKEQLAYQQELLERISEVQYYSRRESIQSRFVFESRQMQNLLRLIDSMANTDATVLLLGETGVGKDVLAKYIHEKSPRTEQAFFKVDCTAIPGELMESELFGYDPGAFSGASAKGKPGYVEMAHKGTLFLDEIGELPLTMQAKLLRLLQDQEIIRIGSSKVKKVDVRFIAATNRNLEAAVREGMFRRDLYYRLQVAVAQIPPLRERQEDILPLVSYFLNIFNAKYRKSVVATPEAEAILQAYSWPGNVRELENFIHGMVIVLQKKWIETADLPPSMHPASSESMRRSLPDILCDMEKELLRKALDTYGSPSEVARHFNVDRTTIFRKLKKYSLR